MPCLLLHSLGFADWQRGRYLLLQFIILDERVGRCPWRQFLIKFPKFFGFCGIVAQLPGQLVTRVSGALAQLGSLGVAGIPRCGPAGPVVLLVIELSSVQVEFFQTFRLFDVLDPVSDRLGGAAQPVAHILQANLQCEEY